jgi:hypothetical protein
LLKKTRKHKVRAGIGQIWNEGIGSRVFEAYLGVFGINGLLFTKKAEKEDFLIYFLHHIGYHVIIDFLMANILPSLRSIPQ